jgi:hypothetical protein
MRRPTFSRLNSGSLNLQNNAGMGFGQGGNHTGTSTFVQNGGSVTFFSDAGSTLGGTGSLNLGNGGSTGTYAYHLNGGTLDDPVHFEGRHGSERLLQLQRRHSHRGPEAPPPSCKA